MARHLPHLAVIPRLLRTRNSRPLYVVLLFCAHNPRRKAHFTSENIRNVQTSQSRTRFRRDRHVLRCLRMACSPLPILEPERER